MSTLTVNRVKTSSLKEPTVTLLTTSGPPPMTTEEMATKAHGEEIWDRVIRGLIYSLAFLLPILVTPWTFEPLEFSKQMLLFVLTSAAAIAWLLKLLVWRTWRFVRTPLDVPIGIFLLVYFLASLFSVDRVASFLGYYGSFHGNFFQVLFLVLLYYLILNNFENLRQLKRLLGVFSFAAFLALLFVILQFLGLFVLPFSFARATSFNTIGGLLMISLFAAFASTLSIGIKSHSWFSIFSGRIWRIILLFCAFVVLLTVNFLYAWAALLLGLLVQFVFQFGFSGKLSMKDLLRPLFLLILVIAFLVVQLVFPTISVRNIFNFNLPVEVRLDYITAKPVLLKAVADRPILGSGPNTFLYAFSKHREESFNLSPFWNARFDKAPSEATEYLVGTGILGLIAFEIFNLIFIIYGLFFLFRKKKDEAGWGFGVTVFSGFAVLWLAHWFFFFNTVMAFAFWLLVASFLAFSRLEGGERLRTISFSLAATPRQAVSIVSVVALSLVVIIIFLFFVSAIYVSDIFYRRAFQAAAQTETHDLAQRSFERAIRLNRFRPDYYLAYGEFLFVRINQELAKREPSLGLIQNWISLSINTSRAAVNLSPVNWTAWERLATLYTFARPFVAGVDKFIVESLVKATENDPKNPILFVELGEVYRLAARRLDPEILGRGVDSDGDGLSDEQERILASDLNDPDTNGNNVLDGREVLSGLNPAGTGNLPDSFLGRYIKTDAESLVRSEEAVRKAVVLKEDYAAAYYQLALTLEQQNKIQEAIETLEKALQRFPANLTIKFELGRLYFNTGKIDLAARQFQEITILQPNHSNSIFSLAVSYERLDKKRRALEEYRKVLKLNPEHVGLQAKVQALEEELAREEKSKR